MNADECSGGGARSAQQAPRDGGNAPRSALKCHLGTDLIDVHCGADGRRSPQPPQPLAAFAQAPLLKAGLCFFYGSIKSSVRLPARSIVCCATLRTFLHHLDLFAVSTYAGSITSTIEAAPCVPNRHLSSCRLRSSNLDRVMSSTSRHCRFVPSFVTSPRFACEQPPTSFGRLIGQAR